MKHDCYFLGDRGCRALTETVCNSKPCAFFKTPKEYLEAQINARKRLAALGRPELLRKRKDSEDNGA